MNELAMHPNDWLEQSWGMKILNNFETLETHATFRPSGQVTLPEAISLVTEAITEAREKNVQKMLIDVSQLTGFEPPTVTERYIFITAWAAAAQGAIRIAMVTIPEMIDPQKFGVTVAANAGLTCDVFTNEEDALQWLLMPGYY